MRRLRPTDYLPANMLLGIAPLDAEHAELVAQLRRLQAIQNQPISSEIVGEVNHVIGRALLAHFENEEVIMKLSAMPADELQEHMSEHLRIVEEYTNLQLAMIEGGNVPASEIIDKVEGWVMDHIANFDLAIRQYVFAE